MDALTSGNKQLLATIFDGLARGDARAFRESLADDFTWVLTGTTAWSGTYRGKEAVLRELMQPLFANFAGTYTNRATRIVGEGEVVVVECEGSVETKQGGRYDNRYCWVCIVRGGRLAQVTEYMDTELVTRALVR